MTDEHEHDRQHDRRYRIFAVAFGAAVLVFAAISISIVILTA